MNDETIQWCVLCHHPADAHEEIGPEGNRPCRSVGHSKGVPCRECRRLISAEHVAAVMRMREEGGEAFEVAWGAYTTTLDHVRRNFGDAWQAFFTDVHQSALASALIAYRETETPTGTRKRER